MPILEEKCSGGTSYICELHEVDGGVLPYTLQSDNESLEYTIE